MCCASISSASRDRAVAGAGGVGCETGGREESDCGQPDWKSSTRRRMAKRRSVLGCAGQRGLRSELALRARPRSDLTHPPHHAPTTLRTHHITHPPHSTPTTPRTHTSHPHIPPTHPACSSSLHCTYYHSYLIPNASVSRPRSPTHIQTDREAAPAPAASTHRSPHTPNYSRRGSTWTQSRRRCMRPARRAAQAAHRHAQSSSR